MLAARLLMDCAALGELSRHSLKPAAISSTCVVFAETEIVGLLADGAAAADIVVGVQQAIALRVSAMVGSGLEPPICFTGGVALQSGMLRALEAAMGYAIRVAPQPQFTGARGAAILAGRFPTRD